MVANELEREVVGRLDRDRRRETDSVSHAGVVVVELLADVPVHLDPREAPGGIDLEEEEDVRLLEVLDADARARDVQVDLGLNVALAEHEDAG